jgi:hypothetical protein
MPKTLPETEPLFRLEDYWPEHVLGMIPCWGRRKSCALYPGEEIRLFGRTRKRSVGCGDCDIFQSRLELFERLAEAKEREERLKRAQWWASRHGDYPLSEEELLRKLDAERERDED